MNVSITFAASYSKSSWFSNTALPQAISGDTGLRKDNTPPRLAERQHTWGVFSFKEGCPL